MVAKSGDDVLVETLSTSHLLTPSGERIADRRTTPITGAGICRTSTCSLVYDFGVGGGWGDPLDRDPAALLEDVWDEIVSIEGAAPRRHARTRMTVTVLR
jgi:hypothetical protein